MYLDSSFDFSIPLNSARLALLYRCIEQYSLREQSKQITNMLLLRIVNMVARSNFEDMGEYLSSISKYVDKTLNKYNNSIFAYEEEEHTTGDQYAGLKKQYAEYISALEEKETKEKEDKHE